MTLIGRLGATPEAIKDKQGRDLLVYSVATLDRAQVNSDGCEFLEATPAKTGRRLLQSRWMSADGCLHCSLLLVMLSNAAKADPSTTWHRVLSYQANGRDYLSTLPKG